MIKILIFLTLSCLTFSSLALAKTKEEYLTDILSLYKKGYYSQTIEKLEPLTKISGMEATAYYLKGICYNKLQEFDKSEANFKLAVHHGADATDLHYERGQALYASQQLDEARKSFAHSVQSQYLVPSSLYYMGYISGLMEQYHTSLKYYRKIENDDNKDVAQSASFQIGEIIYSQAETRPNANEIVKDFVLPQMEKAHELASNSSLAMEIQQRIIELKEKYDLDENKMINGKKLSDKRLTLSFRQSFLYDSNVITEADEPTQKAVHKDSINLKSNLNSGYRFNYLRRFILSPKMRVTYDDYATNRDNVNIKKNDSYSLQPRLETSIEHSVKGKPASLTIGVEQNYTAKRNAPYTGRFISGQSYYSRTMTYSLAEKIDVLSFGDSTFSLKRKNYIGTTAESETNTNTFGLSQTFITPSKKIILLTLNADFTTAPKNTDNSQNVYLIRGDYIISKCIGEIQCSPALSLTITDTKKLKATRGIEKTIAPSLTLSRTFDNDTYEIAAKYDFTKNISKDKQSYAYTKHVVGLEFQIKY